MAVDKMEILLRRGIKSKITLEYFEEGLKSALELADEKEDANKTRSGDKNE